MLCIPLVAEFGTVPIEKAMIIISGSIFSENIGWMTLKFGEEIEQRVIDQQPSLVRIDFL